MKLRAFITSTGLALAATLFAVQAEAQSVNAYATTSVNLRAGPSTSYPVVTVVPAGAAIANNGCLADYSWCDVSYANYRGWLAARYMKVPYQGQRQVLTPGIAFATGIAVTAFSQSYWNNYYRGYPWYGAWNRYPPPPPPRPYRPPPGWRAPPGWGGPPPGWRPPPGYRPGWGAPPPHAAPPPYRPPPHAAPPPHRPPHRPPPGARPPYYGPGPVRPGPSMRPGERRFDRR
ncbi:MAG: hypothetical protein CML23_14700 [Rhizobiaceae bacterium]|nr:hypothetical protein [Rhizobiaceae bacterium]